MSSLIVEVCQIDKVESHPNADRLDLYTIKGWTVIGSKLEDGSPRYSVGDKVVYVPPETVVPEEVAVRHGVKPYLKPLPKENGVVPPGGRVTVANLRSVKSYGYIALPDDPTWEVGDDVANIYGFTKYDPPEPTQSNNHGDAEKPHPSLPKYFDMENLKNYPRVIPDGEPVVVSIKQHGMSYKLGIIREPNSEGQAVWKWAAASNSVRRKKYQEKFNKDGTYSEELCQFWKPLDEPTRNLLAYLSGCGYTPEQIDAEPPVMVSNPGQDVAVYGEIYGSGVQDLTYGYKNGEVAWRAFDILVGGTRYLDYQEKTNLFNRFGVRTVAYVYEGPYSFEKMMELCEGHCLKELAIKHGVEGADKQIQEGLVIFTRREQPCRAGRHSMSRSQFKLISFEYLNRKGGTERH